MQCSGSWCRRLEEGACPLPASRSTFFSILASLLVVAFLLKAFAPSCFTRPAVPWFVNEKDETHTSGKGLGDKYLIGVGKADITGPVVEINLMGYADPKQLGTGLRQRLYSRAFIVGDPDHPDDRFVYLVLDTQSGDTAIRYGIINAVKELGPSYAVYGHLQSPGILDDRSLCW